MTFTDRLFTVVMFGLAIICWVTPEPVFVQSLMSLIAGIMYVNLVKARVFLDAVEKRISRS